MKLRLLQPGFEHYTAQLGVVTFEDGLSNDDVSKMDALRISGVMHCEWEDGTSPSLSQQLLENNQMSAPILGDHLGAGTSVEDNPVLEQTNFTDGAAEVEIVSNQKDRPEVVEVVDLGEEVQPKFWTQAELEAIADASGIKGLRDIADPLGIKGQSINGLIAELIQKGLATKTVE